MCTTNTRKIASEITRSLFKVNPEFVRLCEVVIETLGGYLPTAEDLFHQHLNLSELSSTYKTLLVSKIEELEPAFKVTVDATTHNLYINGCLIVNEDDLLDVVYNLGE
jgi:hypothetical protein